MLIYMFIALMCMMLMVASLTLRATHYKGGNDPFAAIAVLLALVALVFAIMAFQSAAHISSSLGALRF